MRIHWNTALRGTTLLCLTVLMVTQFNNCGTFTAPVADDSSSSLLACESLTCVTPTSDNLSITVNSGPDFSVWAGLSEWNIGGDCNEGGFPYNEIIWELYLNGGKVRDSNYPGMLLTNATSNVNTKCTNGRFSIYMNLKAIANDQLNRAGLIDGTGNVSTGGRSHYDLYIEIVGLATPTGTPIENTITGRAHVNLNPVY